MGIIALRSLNTNFFPERELRNVQITVLYPGASPEEVEEGIVLKIEKALKGIEGVEQITSTSTENRGSVLVEGLFGVDPEELLSDVKNAVDQISSFPVGSERPTVFREKSIDRVVTLLLLGDADLFTLKKNAELIEDELLASGKVSQISLVGFPELELSINVEESVLQRFSLTMDEVSRAIRANNLDLTGGSLKGDREEILIRARNKRYTPEALGNIVVRTNADGSMLRLRDIAEIKEQFAEAPNKTTYNGKRAVTIQINKTIDEDLLAMSDYARNFVKEYNERGTGLQLAISSDASKIIRARLKLLIKNGIMGLILVFLFLGIFLNVRLSFWVALSIPIAFAGMFIIGYFAGITINVISLFGMILVIGILVDDGIVFGENIYTQFEKGRRANEAALRGTLEVLPSVFAAISTTVVIFVPFFFLEGRLGEAFWQMALVVIACLSISLVEGGLVLPAHLAHSRALTRREPGKVRRFLDGVLNFLRLRLYAPVLRSSLKMPYIALCFGIAFILLVQGACKGELIKGTFFPFVDSDNITVDLLLNPGSREMETEEILQRIEDATWEVNKALKAARADSQDVILSTIKEIGQAGSESGKLEIELLDGEIRNLESFVIADSIRRRVGNIPQAQKLSVGGRQIFGKPVVVSMTSRDLNLLEAAKERMKQELNSFPALKDVIDNNIEGKRELNITLKPRGYFLGLTPQEVARQLRQGFFGDEAQRLQIGSDEVKVWVRYPPEGRMSLGNLDRVRIKANGNEYPLPEVADYELKRGIVGINHLNGAREIKVEADLANANEPLTPILNKIKEDIVPLVVGEFPGIQVRFEGQDKENQKFQRSAQRAFPLAILSMIVILILTFRSVSQMLIIFFIIPLGVFGAVLGHYIEGKPISIFSMYGIIALSGVVVNDAVVFISKFNSNLRQGMDYADALFDTGVARFRAILLTSATTAAGLYPLILEKSRQAQFLIPMAISVAWGIIFGTIFTLLVLPSIIHFFNDWRRLMHWIWHGVWIPREQAEPAIRERERLKNEGEKVE